MDRIQKVLAAAGVASRRACEELVSAGRVTVNGKVVTQAGTCVAETDVLAVDGRVISRGGPRQYCLLNKPAGYVTTAHDPQGRPTVLDLVGLRAALPARRNRAACGVGADAASGVVVGRDGGHARLFPVGRLDADSEGLVLLTNDGDLAYRLTHPRFALEKEYRVLVEGAPSSEALQRLRSGVELDGRPTAPALVEVENAGLALTKARPGSAGRGQSGIGVRTAKGVTETWLRFVIHEGRNRQIRRMCLAVGHPVRRLIRVRVGNLRLGGLKPGQWRPLVQSEIDRLKELTSSPNIHADRQGLLAQSDKR